jgi:hypothetical protein
LFERIFPLDLPFHPASPFTTATETLIGGRNTAGILTVIVSKVGGRFTKVLAQRYGWTDQGGSSASLAGSGDLKKMTERWFKDGSWLKELP